MSEFMSQLDEWVDYLEDITDRLFISGLENVPKSTMSRLYTIKQQFHEAGLSYGCSIITEMIQQLELSRMNVQLADDTNGGMVFIRLQSFIDAARRIRQLSDLRDYYGLV